MPVQVPDKPFSAKWSLPGPDFSKNRQGSERISGCTHPAVPRHRLFGWQTRHGVLTHEKDQHPKVLAKVSRITAGLTQVNGTANSLYSVRV